MQTAQKVLCINRRRAADLSLVFVTDQRIRALNRRYLRHNYATDVLAFDLRPGPKGPLSGEIIISTGAVKRNAKTYHTTAQRELTLYIVHGILHLLGYRDKTAAQCRRMRRAEAQALKHLS